MVLGPDFDRILAAAKAGADWAWAELYRDLAGVVHAYLAARGARDPEDLASEAFLQVARDIGSFQGDEAGLRAWVFVIVHRRLVDHWRALRRRPQPDALDDSFFELAGGDCEAEAVERLTTAELLSAFERLSDDQRAVLTLRIVGNLTLAETARVLGKRVGAIKALQRRALISLQADAPRRE
jgi:RNA polymerase sigma factor (sigma-70 family)